MNERTFGKTDRAAYGAALLVLVTVLGLSRILVPRPEGTHQQLGLPPCAFQTVTGVPCPSCGLTTSFAHMARLDVGSATAVQPFGVLLFSLSLAALPVLAGLLAARVPLARVLRLPAVRGAGWCLFAAYLAAWLYKLGALA